MNGPQLRISLGMAAFLLGAGLAPAQQVPQNQPHVGYVYPAGGQQGTEFEVVIGGQFLDGVSQAYFSGSGVKAKLIEHFKPITQGQTAALRNRIQVLQEKKDKDPKAQEEIKEARQKLMTFARRPANPALVETVRLQVTVAPKAKTGPRELRLLTTGGLTNPLPFHVNALPEFSRKFEQVLIALRNPNARNVLPTSAATANEPLRVTLPAVLNGQVMPGRVNTYAFPAKKDQNLVVSVCARDLVPYLSDAVPGWFQASIVVRNSRGKELAFADHYEFRPDPVVLCAIPEDGEYTLEVRDSIYRGRDDFVYRITIGELPFVTSAFPLGGKIGTDTTVALTGWNLPTSELKIGEKATRETIETLFVRKGGLVSNPVSVALGSSSECLEREPNDTPAQAQSITAPIIVNGRIERADDRDVFRIDSHAGDEIVFEVMARRLDSPLDSSLELTDAVGKRIAFDDDHDDRGAGLLTHQADSYLRCKLPADGAYFLYLTDAQHKGGLEYAYRLRISPPRPNFALRLVPSSINVRSNATVPLTVYALREDSFSGPIALALKNAPPGFTLSGGRIPADQDQVRVTLTAPPARTEEPVSLALIGRASISGQEVTREAVPADDMMQAFAYHHLVPARQLKVAVGGKGPALGRNAARVLTELPLKIPAGGNARLQVSLPFVPPAIEFEFELSDPIAGLSIKKVTESPGERSIELETDASKLEPGLSGNLIVTVFARRMPQTDTKKAQQARRSPVGTLPAIPFEIVVNTNTK